MCIDFVHEMTMKSLFEELLNLPFGTMRSISGLDSRWVFSKDSMCIDFVHEMTMKSLFEEFTQLTI